MTVPVLNIAARRCSQCLTTRQRIVSGARAAQIVRDCRASDNHFFCHRGAPGEHVHCRGVHEISPGRAYRMAEALGLPIVEHDMDAPERKGET